MPLAALAPAALQLGMGIAQGALNDRRQLRQNAKLREQNMWYDQRWARYQQDLAMEMWEKTNYSAQKEQMKKAGLNPALMYGMGGGGGTTTGPTSGQSASHAPVGGGELQASMAMMPQVALLMAQKENIEADTKLKEVEANKRAGVDTEAVKADIDAKTAIAELTRQQTDNERWRYEILKLDKAFKEIEIFEKQQSQEDRLDQIEYNSKILGKQLALLNNELAVSDATVKDKIKIIQQEAVYSVLKNTATKWQTAKTESEMRQIANDIKMQWKQLGNEQEKIRLLNRQVMVAEGQEFNVLKSLDNILVPMMLPIPKKEIIIKPGK